uniref:Uncharacterized protein n=1 Tax=Rhizophora mucronata TaxID=61149 RepID=A0A2P2PAB9_RHIMU
MCYIRLSNLKLGIEA